jgi:hypothetical protein
VRELVIVIIIPKVPALVAPRRRAKRYAPAVRAIIMLQDKESLLTQINEPDHSIQY